MLLAIDVGNTQTVIGLFGPEDPENKEGDLVDHWRIVTVAERTSDELALLLRQFIGWHGVAPTDHITGIAISSVVPSVTLVSSGASFGRVTRLTTPTNAPVP